jgi:uncharacterized protein
MNDQKTAVLYHGSCADGFGAAYAAWTKLGDAAQYIPVTYGHPFPAEQVLVGSMVYLLDFSYPRPILDDLATKYSCTVQVIDHHKTAQEALADFPGAIFDMDHSGAYLAWQYFHNVNQPPHRQSTPPLIQYVEDRDMWWWRLPKSREISAALWSYPMDFSAWDRIRRQLDRALGRQKFADEGAAILRYMEQQVVMICRHAAITQMDGHDIPVVNATTLFSEVGEMLLQMFPACPFAAAYRDNRRDGVRSYSLRSRGDFDVSAIARIRGGGGHKAAAGFEERLP